MNTTSTHSPVNGFTLWVRYALIAVCILFLIGGVVQFFLAGLSVFDGPEYWSDHVDLGRMLGFLTYLMPILALIGRVGMPRIGHAFVVAILFFVQSFLANVDTGWVAAFHPLNGLVLMGAASSLASNVRRLGQPEQGNPPAPAVP
ncbi:MAG: DUF6220 domain-containing protein [Thermomicrobiales bacterium]